MKLILPRNANKIKPDYKSDDMYKFYVQKCKSKNVPYVSKVKYTQILKKFFQEKFNHIIYSNEEFILPARLGSIRIRRRKGGVQVDVDGNIDKSRLKMNYRATLEYWEKEYPDKTLTEIKQIPDRKIIYHLNPHTDGDSVHFMWDKITSNVRNQSAYMYHATRTLKRTLSKVVKTLNIQYYG